MKWVLCTQTDFEKAEAVDPARSDLPWVPCTNEQAAEIANNREWETVENPDFGKVIERKSAIGVDDEEIITERIDDRPRIIVRKAPVQPTEEQVAAVHDAAVRLAIRHAYPVEEEIRLLAAAVEAFSAGEKPSEEWTVYRAAVARIKEETP